MHYTIVGLKETGQLAAYDRSAARPSLEDVGRICHTFGYSQLIVMENDIGGDVRRYAYDRAPKIREVPLNG